MKAMLSMLLAASLALGGIMLVGPAESGEVVPSITALTPHTPIIIVGDADFIAQATTETWSGFGTPGDPYVIEEYDIDSTTGNGIDISKTNLSFIIRNNYLHDGGVNVGIRLSEVINGTIFNCTIEGNEKGIDIQTNCHNISILNNTILNTSQYSINMIFSSYINIRNNTIENSQVYGVYLYHSDDCEIDNNTISNTSSNALWVEYNCTNVEIWNNHLSNNSIGIHLAETMYEHIHNNTLVDCSIHIRGDSLEYWDTHKIDLSNTVNGKPVSFIKNQTGLIIQDEFGELILVNCSNVNISNQNMTGGSNGILLGFCINVNISNSSFSNIGCGILTDRSNDNCFQRCVFNNVQTAFLIVRSNNNSVLNNSGQTTRHGLEIMSSDYNIFKNNTFNHNNSLNSPFDRGLYIQGSKNNTFSDNIISNFEFGVDISDGMDISADNEIYHNSFINNQYNGVWFFRDSFDNGYPLGGNYWSDYSGTDHYYGPNQNMIGIDGIGDVGYLITGGAIDNYPLMQPYTGQLLGPDTAQAPFALNYTPNGTAVLIDTDITITWNETMNWTSVANAFNYTDGITTWTSANGTWVHDDVTNVSVYTPALPLAYETLYTVAVNCTATDIIGNLLDQDLSDVGGQWPQDVLTWEFMTDDEAPYVIYTQPADGQFDVDPNKPFKIMFSERMNRTSAEAAFSYTDGNQTWNITDGSAYWNLEQTEMTFTLDLPLETNTSYTAELDGNIAKDIGGKLLKDGNYTWNFMTWGAPPAPRITSTYPPAGAFNVNVNTYINVIFDSSMDTASVEGAFNYTDGTTVWTASNGTVDWFSENTIFSFQPTEKLDFDTDYVVRMSSDAMSIYGMTLDGNQNGVSEADDDYAFGFATTAEPPVVLSHYPTPSQTGVPTDLAAIYINFSAVMNLNSVTSAISISPNTPFTSVFTGGGRNLTLVLNSGLQEGAEYRITVLGTAMDLGGMKLDGNGDGWPGDKFSFVFYTEGVEVPEGPKIVAIFPLNNATIPVGVGEFYVGISFNNPMNRTSVENAFSFKNASEAVNGTFTWSETSRSMKFLPATQLAYNTTYTVTLSGTAKDEGGRSIGNSTSWQYITVTEEKTSDMMDWLMYGLIIGLLILTTMLYMANRSLRRDLKRTRVKLKRLKRQAGIKDDEPVKNTGEDDAAAPEKDLLDETDQDVEPEESDPLGL
ncbi:MAG: Ig-like domain-containing protein [Candidatus Thermoplasmatota archaeon]|nr:Ig-like domain-containing protein [Candidatus Thermoplasmatota archaeon]MBU4143374.1 Ig-like domain-containing protein [Candidatus Thermoplasmatota archaeon]MBU4591200.1 Ig-like domain-containing protein [Candidatus Thermoplasmatota archaeon]